MKALGLVVSDKKIFEDLIVNPVTYFCNQSEPFENNFGRGPPRDHSC